MAPAGSTLPRLASEVDSTLVLLDPVHGAMGLQEQLAALVDTTDAERVALVDVGGDILGTGTEPELKSPLADALALAATDALPVPVEVLVPGAGLDGELSEQTVLSRIRQLGDVSSCGSARPTRRGRCRCSTGTRPRRRRCLLRPAADSEATSRFAATVTAYA
jgi:hypothetical protein